jgi:cytochrome c oxidase subunit 3
MKQDKQRTGVPLKRPVFERIEGLHPFKMINYLFISVSCLLFAFITFMFIKHLAFELNGEFSFYLPKFFTVSAILLICSVYFTTRLLPAFKNDDITYLRRLLLYTLITGMIFFIFQSVAWIEMLDQSQFFESRNDIPNYVFTFSALHLVYVFAGMIMSGIFFYKFMLIENDPVKILIATTNPVEKVRLQVFATFWHFNVLCWTLIFLMLLFIF